MTEIPFVQDSTKLRTTGKSSENGGTLEEHMVTSAVEKKSDHQNSLIDIPLTKDPLADITFMEDTTKFMPAEKSVEDGSNLDDFRVASGMEEATLTTPSMVVVEELGQKLINDLHEPLMVLESDGKINKNKFSIALVEQSSAGKNFAGKKNQAEHHKLLIWQILTCLGHLWTNVRLKQEPVPAQRRTWDPGIT
ncbi:hypothetical protein CTI12_AA222990 [Artemisia annua]|uniref:Uncharacterized protein n=1 Tax=Artemisia annua TaxID=35608 RepID=A0A2U1NNP9_ARTAN|nr:hypothetical protein CTI12_AA222990 [Artemisia annua]